MSTFLAIVIKTPDPDEFRKRKFESDLRLSHEQL
jgi:hypothetical protein